MLFVSFQVICLRSLKSRIIFPFYERFSQSTWIGMADLSIILRQNSIS